MKKHTRTHTRHLIVLVAAGLLTSLSSQASPVMVKDATHVTARHEKGRCFGWPANGGIWSWGNEILVQYRGGEFQDKPVGSHDINYNKPILIEQSRSFDGGQTWTQHAVVPIQITEPEFAGPAGAKFPEFGPPMKGVPALTTPINFADPNTILHFSWGGYLYHSPDRGVTWKGPFQLPMFDQLSWQLRTDYLVEDCNTVLAFWSGSKVALKRNENGGMVYMVKTVDGGVTWTKEALVSRVAEPSEQKHDVALMPATVRVSPTKLVCCIRNLTINPQKVGWIECRVSTDNGKTWSLQSKPVGDEAGTTPPALSRLADGRLALAYGYRKPANGPTSIRAKISEDDGKTWGEELILRTGGGDEDIGYTRQVVRPDGKIVTIYYWQEDEKAERDIAATIWTPPAAPSRGPAARSPAFYYVDAVNGDNNNTGASLDQAWRTLQKAVDTMASGDTAYIRAGTYRETVMPRNGQTFAAYRGEKPLITGAEPVSGWTVHSGSIYKATVNTKVYDVFVGANYMHKARWPNFEGDYLDVSSWAKGKASTQSHYRVAFDAMTPPADLAGGWYCGIHGQLNFCPQEGRITAVSGRQLTLTDIRENDWHWTDPKHSGAGVGYIVNHLNCLDQAREWHWENDTLYFWAPGGGKPNNVWARTRICGFVLQNVSNVTLKVLYFQGASVHVNGGSNNTVDGCHFRNVSPWGNAKGVARLATSWGSIEDGTTGLHIMGTNHTIQNCSLVGGWGTGIRLDGGSDLTVRNNYIEDFGWFGRILAAPISGFGTRLRIENNTIKRSGGCGITLKQKNPGDGSNVNHVRFPTIRHNDIRDVAYLLMDGGSFIYINNDDVPSAERRLDGEIAFNVCVGLRSRSTDKFFWGIYIDNGTDFVTIHHNVINSLNPKTAGAGIFLHGAQHHQENIFCYHNTIWGNFDNAIASHTWSRGSISNVVFRNNHAQKTGFRATAIGGVTASHNRENVPPGEFIDVTGSDFRLVNKAYDSFDKGMVIEAINDARSASPYAGEAPDLGAYELGGRDWRLGSTVEPPTLPMPSTAPE